MKYVKKTFGLRGLLVGIAISAVVIVFAIRAYEELHPDENKLSPYQFVNALGDGDLQLANSALVDGKFVASAGRLEFHFCDSNGSEQKVDWGIANDRFDEIKRAEVGLDLGSFGMLDPNRKWVTLDNDSGVGEEVVSSPVYKVWFQVLYPGGYFFLDPSHAQYFEYEQKVGEKARSNGPG